ncbi:hypothetical protein UFOVP27_38 [uncultured Caudovirales phage]|uniref:Uncharacterized protein n=1 Tax=uncultured Caudovirales phage TaxID=2100421 RepID=A0A6J5KK27_9CAUD|nr:hypothetical protein UFOVP27_38 [uncultured Caudovirales phage]
MRIENKSLNQSINEGATDGKYRKVRPNTTVAPGTGDEIMLANRRALHPYWNYDFIDQESGNKVNPGADEANSKPRASMPVSHIENDQMGANY